MCAGVYTIGIASRICKVFDNFAMDWINLYLICLSTHCVLKENKKIVPEFPAIISLPSSGECASGEMAARCSPKIREQSFCFLSRLGVQKDNFFLL